jgi:hypothetical protein
MTIEQIKKEFDYEGKPEQWRLGFDTLLKCLPDVIRANNVVEKNLFQKEQKSCSRLKDLLDAEIPIIEKHLETHKWLRQISDPSQGIIDFIEQYGWLMRDMYCHSACPDGINCSKIL